MKQDVKEKWVQALRSGEYQQGNGVLHRPGRTGDYPEPEQFCCLGVLCRIAVESGLDIPVHVDSTVHYDYHSSYLPRSVSEWAGIDDINPTVTVTSYETPVALSYLNDNDTTFSEIADLIEEQL